MLQRLCDKAVDTYPSTIKFVPECFYAWKRCDSAVDTSLFVFDSVSDGYKNQESWIKLFPKKL